MSRDDYLRCDRIWQRVDPALDPYPQIRAERDGVGESCSLRRSAADRDTVAGLIEQELADRRMYLAHLPCAPDAGSRRVLRQIAEEEGGHARRMMSIYFLMTGACFQPATRCEPYPKEAWRDFLRRCYQEECAAAYTYRRLAEETEDVCLRRTGERFCAEEYHHAELLLPLMERIVLAQSGLR